MGISGAAAAGNELDGAIPRYLTPRRRQGVQQALEEGRADKQPPAPLRHRGKRLTEGEKRRLHSLEDRRNHRATELAIDPTLIAPRALLIALAGDWKEHEHELMSWQRELLA